MDFEKIGKGPLAVTEQIKSLADRAHAETYELYLDRLDKEYAGNVIFYDMFNKRFAELVSEYCAQICMSQADRANIRHAFGIQVESNVKYPGTEPHNSIESQYNRELNTTKIS